MSPNARTEPAPLVPDGAWSRILVHEPAEAVLERLVEGDPLDLRRRIRHVVAEGCLLVDAERAFLRAAAGCARGARSYGGSPELCAWIDERVREAVWELARGADELRGDGSSADPPDVFDLLARFLGFKAAALRRAARAFNACSDDQRSAFRQLILEPSYPGLDGPSRRVVGYAAPERPLPYSSAGAAWRTLLAALEA